MIGEELTRHLIAAHKALAGCVRADNVRQATQSAGLLDMVGHLLDDLGIDIDTYDPIEAE